jgi:phage terminase large subunit
VSSLKVEIPAPLLPLFKPNRYKVLYGGRGSAKSWSVARALVALAAAKPLRVLCARETQKSIQESVHRLLRDQIEVMGLAPFFEVQETRILGRNGSDFAFAGIRQQGIANLKSFEGVDVCWVEEAQVVTRRSWDTLIPTIRKLGSEIWITFNPELDTDETYQRFVVDPPQGAWVQKVNYSSNPWFPPELEAERQQMLRRDPDGYRTTWDGECRAAVEGAIYARELEQATQGGRITLVPYDPLLKVHTVWDLGFNDSMAIICAQQGAGAIRIIDYIEDSHRTLAEYVRDLQAKPWQWGTDWLPHDGRAKDFKSGKSAEEILQQLGRAPQIVPEIGVEPGIKAARMAFARVYFDKHKAAPLLQCLKRYRRSINQVTNEPGAPVHDSASHGADAFRYLGVVADKLRNESSMAPINYAPLGIV